MCIFLSPDEQKHLERFRKQKEMSAYEPVLPTSLDYDRARDRALDKQRDKELSRRKRGDFFSSYEMKEKDMYNPVIPKLSKYSRRKEEQLKREYDEEMASFRKRRHKEDMRDLAAELNEHSSRSARRGTDSDRADLYAAGWRQGRGSKWMYDKKYDTTRRKKSGSSYY